MVVIVTLAGTDVVSFALPTSTITSGRWRGMGMGVGGGGVAF